MLSGFPPGMYEWGGPKGVGVSGGPPPGEKKSDFLTLVLKMAYFNWNVSKIWKIFLFFLPTRGYLPPPPLVLSGGSGPPPDPPPLAETLAVHAAKYTLIFRWYARHNIISYLSN